MTAAPRATVRPALCYLAVWCTLCDRGGREGRREREGERGRERERDVPILVFFSKRHAVLVHLTRAPA